MYCMEENFFEGENFHELVEDLLGEKLLRRFLTCATKGCHAPKFLEKTFTNT